ncbi:uncharacterized protein EI90DRAFT_3153365 [Cantharellus anzutake]|uniref:uncharacterized protein n=1 Tax=Cantharellus anzutake TaxID=1750568 RepID=UPI0019056EEA|nr:uncharacterized protein EI90DRAFT_3153365 [Cantharellus anzutake]KAF8333978.1 hypothetical protein EI90DRAFT_3153365 [Cantharellus anzutake]
MAAPPPLPMNLNMEIPGGPPMPNVLYPHHVGLTIMILVYHRGVDYGEPGIGPTTLHPKVRMRMLRVLAREIGELKPPTPYHQLVSKLVNGFDDPSLNSELALLSHTLNQAPKMISTPEVMGDLFSDVRSLVPGVDEPEENTSSCAFERRSFFGMFIRRSFLSFRKLSFAGQLRLCNDFIAWCDGDKGAGYYIGSKERRRGLLIYPGILDLPENAKQSYYEIAGDSLKTGDSKAAVDNLRRFFDQRFAATDDTTMYQHSLLSMATLHYTRGELLAARQFLDEAIKISKEKNDHFTLDRCQNLMQRLDPDPGSAFLARDRAISVQVWGNPLDILWEIKKLLELGEGLKILFTKVAESIGVWDAKSVLINVGVEKWPRHAVCAILWRLAGVETLAKCHENIILAFTQVGDDDSRMSVVCARASRYTRQGATDEALKLLLDPQTWRGLTFQQYQIWALEVWNVFNFTAERKGHASFQRDFLMPNQPSPRPEVQSVGAPSPFHRRTVITESLQLALRYKEANQPVLAVQPLMEAVWSSEFRGMFQYYRIAVVLLADIAIDLGLPKSGQHMIEEVLPQILLADDLELRAYGSLTYARLMMAGAGADINEEILKEARPHLIRAVRDYRTISKFEKALEALYILSAVCHNLRAVEERDAWAAQFNALDAERRTTLSAGVDEETLQIFRIVTEVAYVIGQTEK